MTDQGREDTNDATATDISDATRRAVLGGTALGASGLIAGCSGGGGNGDGGGDTPTATGTQTTGGTGTTQSTGGPTATTTAGELADVSGQTLTYFTPLNPDQLTFFRTNWLPGPQGKYWASRKSIPHRLSFATGGRGPWANNAIKTGEWYPELYESVDVTPSEITIKLNPDAGWSNGDPLTPGDGLWAHIAFRLIPPEPPLDKVSDSPPIFNRAVTDFEVNSDTEFTFHSSHGLWDKFTKQAIWKQMTWISYFGGPYQNTSQAPYEYWKTVQDWWDQAKNGEIQPWTGDFNIVNEAKELLFGPHGWSANPDKNNYDFHWEKHFRDPENVATSGAWTLAAINGTKSVELKPNPEFYAADQVNFDRIKLLSRESDRANRAALKADSQDYYRGTVPQYIVKSFPEAISQRLVPQNGGLVLAFDHSLPLFSSRAARRAIMYAVDTSRVSRTVHRTKYDPVTYAGGHGYRTGDILGDEWAANTLTGFGRDLSKANQLMSEAGFHQEGGKWIDDEGNQLSVTIPSASKTPQLEPAFANQLSQFGVDASLQTYSGSVYNEKLRAGELDMWRDFSGVGFASKVGECWYWFGRRESWAKRWNIWSEEQVNQIEWGPNGDISTNRPSSWAPFTIEAPPVGEPDGDLQEYQAATIAMRIRFPSGIDTFTQDLRQSLWLYNYFMPQFPIANGKNQHFLDTAHYIWPEEDSQAWNGVGVDVYQPETLLSYGRFVHANPENPESGASVEN